MASAKARITDPALAPGDLDTLVGDNADFAFDLLRLATPGAARDNVFFSPHSISIALAMTYAGARGATATQMATALRFTLDPGHLHTAFDALDLALASRGQGAHGADGGPFVLRVVDALFLERDVTFEAPFLDVLAESYGAGAQLMDFAGAAEPSRQSINDWVSAATEGHIAKLLAPGTITSDTAIVLTNAVYFTGAWAQPFEASRTHDAPFTRDDGGSSQVKMMTEHETLPYVQLGDVQAVELAYDGDELAMVLVLPLPGGLTSLEASLSAGWLATLSAALAPTAVSLSMPKVQLTLPLGLPDKLQALGMVDAFDPRAADFSGMSARPLVINAAVHQAYLAIDEKGTTAAAATAVGAVGTSGPPSNEVQLVLDHPYLVIIRDRPTGAVLFVGRIANPPQ